MGETGKIFFLFIAMQKYLLEVNFMKKRMFGFISVILFVLVIPRVISHAEDIDTTQSEESATEGTMVMDEVTEAAINHAGEVISVSTSEKSEEEIEEYCKKLPRYKRPKKIIFADVPRNATGKIEKPKLREMYGAAKLVEEQNRS